MNYGLAYGLSAFGLSQQLGITAEEARGLMENYFAGFGGVRDYLHEVVARARQDGYTSTVLGRRRYLPDLVSDNRQRRDMAERMALNAPIQGSAADIIKVAMLRVDTALRDAGLRVPDAAPGARRAGLRGRPRRAGGAGGAGPTGDGRRVPAVGAAGGLRRRRPGLEQRRPLVPLARWPVGPLARWPVGPLARWPVGLIGPAAEVGWSVRWAGRAGRPGGLVGWSARWAGWSSAR